MKTNFDLNCTALPLLQTIRCLKVMLFDAISYNINKGQCSVLQGSLIPLITVTGCFAVFNKIATGSKNSQRFLVK